MKKVLLITFMFIFFSCKKSDTQQPMTITDVSDSTILTILDAPDNLKAMFTRLPKDGEKNSIVKSYSNNGLTESFTISGKRLNLGTNFRSSLEGYSRITQYDMLNYHYKSSLYGFNFTISQGYLWAIEYCFNFNKNPGFGYQSTWLIDSAFWGVGAPNFMLRFVADSGVNNNLSFPQSDQVSRTLKTEKDCFVDIGSYQIKNKIYTHVYRFKNETQIQQANNQNPHYLWIDRDYGIIQFQLKDSTIWSLDYP